MKIRPTVMHVFCLWLPLWHILQLPEDSTAVMEQMKQSSPSLTAAKQHTDKADHTEAKRSANKELTKDKSETVAGPETDREQIEKKYPIGTMIWGKLPGYDWWPGVLLSYSNGLTNGSGALKKEGATTMEEQQMSDDEDSSCNVVRVWVKWYGDNQLSQVCC